MKSQQEVYCHSRIRPTRKKQTPSIDRAPGGIPRGRAGWWLILAEDPVSRIVTSSPEGRAMEQQILHPAGQAGDLPHSGPDDSPSAHRLAPA